MIARDINRTFPRHPLFRDQKASGQQVSCTSERSLLASQQRRLAGRSLVDLLLLALFEKALFRVLNAYATFNAEVGEAFSPAV